MNIVPAHIKKRWPTKITNSTPKDSFKFIIKQWHLKQLIKVFEITGRSVKAVFELHWRTTAWVHLTLSLSPEEGSIQMCLSILSDGLAFANKQFIIKKETKDASDLTRTRPPFLWLATVTPSHMPSTISVDCAGRETHSINTSVCPKRAFLYIWIWTMR